jgi:hypothetical protein
MVIEILISITVLWPLTLAFFYVKGMARGYRQASGMWGGLIVSLWRSAFKEAMPRDLWPGGTPDDADEIARRETLEMQIDVRAALLARLPANKGGRPC